MALIESLLHHRRISPDDTVRVGLLVTVCVCVIRPGGLYSLGVLWHRTVVCLCSGGTVTLAPLELSASLGELSLP